MPAPTQPTHTDRALAGDLNDVRSGILLAMTLEDPTALMDTAAQRLKEIIIDLIGPEPPTTTSTTPSPRAG